MAVAGLHNVSPFRPFFGESQSPGSRNWGEQQGRPSTRTSSLLQMWREFEDDHMVNPSCRQRQRTSNGSDSDCSSTCTSVGQGCDNGDDISEDADDTRNQRITTGSDVNHEDDESTISEQSSDLGEIERERVRQIFREWMNSGAKGHSTETFHLNNQLGPQCLGENECERVRIIREWVQMNSQHRNNCGSPRDGIAEVGSQIEQVRDGLVITHPQIGARRPVRRLCGRQTLLDLLLKAQTERNGELQDLSEQRPVSDFVHRNRIQVFLRGRFLRNKISIPDKGPSSMAAATELGLLRQRHTVTDLREGFLSKLDKSTSTPVNNADSSSSSSHETNVELESAFREREVADIHTASGLESAADGNRSLQENVARVTEVEGTLLDADGYVQEVSLDVRSVCGSGEAPVLDSEANENEVSADVEHGGNRQAEQSNAAITNELALANENITYSGPLEVFHEPCEPRTGSSYVHEVAGNTSEEFDQQDASTEVEELQEPEIGIEDNAWQQLTGVAFTALTDARGEDIARSWQESSANQWFQEISDNDAVGQGQIQASREDWPYQDLQEAIDRWLDMPSEEVSMSVGRTDSLYYPDDDHVRSMELRELLSRRRVSSLLRSSFRESLDQVLQSHVERQGHTSGDWELDTTSFPSLIELDQEPVNGSQTLAPAYDAEINLFDSSSIQITESQSHWDEELQGANWPHNSSNQNLRTEWELINELRIDMARLHQRMNNMQNMMEACMELQIELQRSVRQEVSAALNQSILSGDAGADADLSSEGSKLHSESQWEYVRKGICCQCCDSNIDSLLYRCGHMCTCYKCAEILVQHRGKCPMCHAPVIEVVRAYFIQ